MFTNIICINDNKYSIDGYITSGGNSKIYAGTCIATNEPIVLKFFSAKGKKEKIIQRYKRFKAEIQKIDEIINLDTAKTITVPYIDSKVPEKLNRKISFNNDIYSSPCIVMKRAENCYDDIVRMGIIDKLDFFIEIAKKLKFLHDNKIYHLDIKPQNIMKYKDEYIFIDFGTSKTPNVLGVTLENEIIGSRNTMAPELLSTARSSSYNYSFADIYSLAKTIWIYLTSDMNCIFDEYDKNSDKYSLKMMNVSFNTYEKIDELLASSTRLDYNKRIGIEEFIIKLEEIKNYEKDKKLYDRANYRYNIASIIDKKKFNSVIINKYEMIAECLLLIKNSYINLILNGIVLENIYISIKSRADLFYFTINNNKFIFSVDSIEIENVEESTGNRNILTINLKNINEDIPNSVKFETIDPITQSSILYSKFKNNEGEDFVITGKMTIYVDY